VDLQVGTPHSLSKFCTLFRTNQRLSVSVRICGKSAEIGLPGGHFPSPFENIFKDKLQVDCTPSKVNRLQEAGWEYTSRWALPLFPAFDAQHFPSRDEVSMFLALVFSMKAGREWANR
jgi:hypothetical protein